MLLGSNRDQIPTNRKLPQNIFFNPVETLKRKREIYALNINSKVLHYTMCFRLNLQSFAKKEHQSSFRLERKGKGQYLLLLLLLHVTIISLQRMNNKPCPYFLSSGQCSQREDFNIFNPRPSRANDKIDPKYEKNKAGSCL